MEASDVQYEKKTVVEANKVTIKDFTEDTVETDSVELKKNKEKRKKVKDEIGACPNCREEHTYFKKWDKINWPSDRLFT